MQFLLDLKLESKREWESKTEEEKRIEKYIKRLDCLIFCMTLFSNET